MGDQIQAAKGPRAHEIRADVYLYPSSVRGNRLQIAIDSPGLGWIGKAQAAFDPQPFEPNGARQTRQEPDDGLEQQAHERTPVPLANFGRGLGHGFSPCSLPVLHRGPQRQEGVR